MRKITVLVDKNDLAAAQALTGAGIAETVRIALKTLRADKEHEEAVRLGDDVPLPTWQELRGKA